MGQDQWDMINGTRYSLFHHFWSPSGAISKSQMTEGYGILRTLQSLLTDEINEVRNDV